MKLLANFMRGVNAAKKVAIPSLLFILFPAYTFAQSIPNPNDRCLNFQNQFVINGKSIIPNSGNFICSASQAALWAIKLLLTFSGTVAILFLIIGGYMYLTSAGNDEQAEKGKKILVNTVIGLVVIILSTAIVTIVSNTLTIK